MKSPCTKCGEPREPDEFYTGHRQCRECFRERAKKYQAARKEKRQAYEQRPERKARRRELRKRRYWANKLGVLLEKAEPGSDDGIFLGPDVY